MLAYVEVLNQRQHLQSRFRFNPKPGVVMKYETLRREEFLKLSTSWEPFASQKIGGGVYSG
jgi:hypothetical protein